MAADPGRDVAGEERCVLRGVSGHECISPRPNESPGPGFAGMMPTLLVEVGDGAVFDPARHQPQLLGELVDSFQYAVSPVSVWVEGNVAG